MSNKKNLSAERGALIIAYYHKTSRYIGKEQKVPRETVDYNANNVEAGGYFYKQN